MADVALIQKADTIIVTTAVAAQKLTGQIKTINPGEELTVKGVPIQTLPAYTKFRSPGAPFRPKEAGHVGYLTTVKGIRAEVFLTPGMKVGEVCRQLGVSEQS
jgi:hypothetical protein